MKHAQASLFIILGVIILGSIGFFYIADSTDSDLAPAVQSVSQTLTNPQEFENYIESCLRTETTQLIAELAQKGFTLKPSISRLHHNTSYSYLCLQEHNRGCVNQLRTRTSIQEEMREALLNRLPFCIDLQSFIDQGYTIDQGDMDVSVAIGTKTISTSLIFPLSITKQGFNLDREEFSITTKSHFGRLYDLANHILNSEIENSRFDKEEWMSAHDSDISIEKVKPYPDTLYSLSKYEPDGAELLTAYFGIQGVDVATTIDTPKPAPVFQGYCHTLADNNCYANTYASSCSASAGVHTQTKPAACQGLSTYDEGCDNCKDCGARKHGESWCEYDSPTGAGFDYVGSRHHLRSCFNGKIYYESCRDFREEICVEQSSSATCRDNRWEDCVLQQSQSACENTALRDCTWHDDLQKSYVSEFENRRCTPQVPPGLKHWQLSGFALCQMGNEYNDCDGALCPQDWIDSAAQFCYSQADCGNYRNINDHLSYNGFYSTPNPPSESVYPPEGLTDKDYILSLSTTTLNSQHPTRNPYENPQSNLNTMMDKIAEYVREVSTWDKEDLMWEYIWNGEIDYWSRHAALCIPWQNPIQSKCSLCGDDTQAGSKLEKNKPCTPYRCQSLGTSCVYESVDGYGRCIDVSTYDTDAPLIQDISSTDLTLNDDYFLIYDGWNADSDVYPHDIVQFQIQTNEDTQCKISMLPSLPYNLIPWEPTSFSSTHNFTYRIPSIEQSILFAQDITQSLTLLPFSRLEELESGFSQIKIDAQKIGSEFGVSTTQFTTQIDRFEQQYLNEIKPQIQSFVTLMQRNVAQLLLELEARRHIIFLKCRDRAGLENTDRMIRFSVANDTKGPTVVSQKVNELISDMQIIFVLNEEAQCRYSTVSDKPYDQMSGRLDCAPLYQGSRGYHFRCSARTPKETVFVRCIDNPPRVQHYSLTLMQSNESKIPFTRFSSALSFRGSHLNISSSFALKTNDTIIETEQNLLDVSLHFDTAMNCQYDTSFHQNYRLYGASELSCNKNVCEEQFSVSNQTLYFACIPNSHTQQNEIIDPIIFQP